jgi:hypothetical protein
VNNYFKKWSIPNQHWGADLRTSIYKVN